VIVLSEGGYSTMGDEYFCEECTHQEFSKMVRQRQQKN
jgi:hypothetical protein